MKYLNKIIVLFLLMICLVSLSAISAVDLDDDDAVIGENGSDNLSVTLSESDSLSLDDENDSNLDENASNGVYYVDSWSGDNGLKNRIKNAKNGDVIYITKSISDVTDFDYQFIGYFFFSIEKSITFIGVGDITLTSKDNWRHFRIDASGQTVKFINITFKGAAASYESDPAGGSIRINNGNVYFENCIFDGDRNEAEDGGAIYIKSGNLYVTNCVFNNCYTTYNGAYTYKAEGGAIRVEGGTGYCKNSTFINCKAQYGGAIAIDSNDFLIENCYFEKCFCSKSGSSPSYGNAIEFDDSKTHNIKNCQFIGMDDTNSNTGIIYIYEDNSPTIYLTNCVLLNQNYGVNGGDDTDSTKTYFTNCWVGQTTNDTGSTYDWTNNLKVKKGSVTVKNTLKLGVTIPKNVTYKQNLTLKYYFVGSDDGKNYTLNIRNMNAILDSTTGDLNTTSASNVGKGFNVEYVSNIVGSNTITCYIKFDATYYSKTLSLSFNSDKATPSLIVTVENAVYGTHPIVYINLTSNTVEKLSGTFNITISNKNGYKKEYITYVTDGKGYISTDILPVSDIIYTIDIKRDADAHYKAVSNKTQFKISPANSTMVFDIDNINYGSNAVMAIYLWGVDGEMLNATVDVTINGKVYHVKVSNGYGSGKVDILGVNKYTAEASWAGNTNYVATKSNTTFNVMQYTPDLIVTVNNVTYGTNASIVVYLMGANSIGITGNVVVTINKKQYTIAVKNGYGYAKCDLLGVSTTGYKVDATFNGNTNYTKVTSDNVFFVKQAVSELFIIINDVYYGDNPVIEARLVGVNDEKLTTDIIVKVDGEDYLVHIVNGKGSNTTKVLSVKNDYKASSSWAGNANYTNASCNTSFNVIKVTPHLEVTVNDVYYGNNATIQVRLTGVNGTNLTAKVTVTINGKNYIIDVKDGVGVNKTIILPANDTYEVEAKLVATENYTAAYAKNNFTVFKANPSLFLTINNVFYGSNAIIEVRLTGVNGEVMNDTLTVNVDGEDYIVKVVNGIGTNKTKILGAGNHSAFMTWVGNTNYTSASCNLNFTVLQVNPTMKVSVEDIPYANNATVVVELWGLDFAPLSASVTVNINETEYILKIVNGYGSFKTERLSFGKYDVKVKLNETENYTATTATTSFKVYKAEPILNVYVSDVVYGTNATVNITLFNEKGEGLTDIVEFTVNNKTYQVNVVNGLGSRKIDVLDVGYSYELVAKLNESENYTGAISKTTFKVSKAESTVIIDVEDCLYGEFSKINLHLTGVNNTGLDGFVYVTIFNQTYLVSIEKGYGLLSLKLDAGSYYAFVSFNGNENYETSFNYTSFDVIGSNATLTVKSKDVTYGEKSIIEVTLTGIDGVKLDGVVWIFVNNETYYISVISGYGFTEINLPAGIQYLSAYWLGDENYNPLMNITSFVVNPANPDLVVSVENVPFNENATVNIQLTGINGEKLNGVVKVIIAGNTYYVNVTNGVGSIKIDLLSVGKYDVVASWNGNSNYTETSFKTSFEVTKVVPTIIIEIGDVHVDEIINITVKTNAVGSMVIIVDGKKYNADIINGIAFVSATGLKLGAYEIIAKYNGNENFTANQNKTILNVKKVSNYTSNISADLNIGSEGGNVTVTLPDDATGEVIVYINGTEYSGEVKDGEAIIYVPGLEPGSYDVVLNYTGDDKYEGLVNKTIVVVSKVSEYDINITGDLNIGSEGGEIVIDFPADATGNVTVIVDGEKYTGEIIDGEVVIDVPGLEPGEHDIIIDYPGDDKYDGFTNETTIDVPKVKEYDFDIYSYLEGNTGVILIFLPHDATGYVEVNGANYKADVINGTATIRITGITPGSFIYNITYSGDDKYESISDSRNITFEYSYYLYVQNLTKYFGNGNQLYAILFDSNGKGIANQTIIITINGKSYSRVTDEQGLVKLNVNLQPGTYEVEASYNDTYTSTGVVEILSTIEGNNLVKMYKNASQYIAKFLDTEGNPLINTSVIFNINGVFYVRSTDENGIAILNINLLPGTYIITAQNANGQLSSNNVTVLPTIIGHDVVKMYNNGTHYYAQILDEQGNPLAGTTIEFNINGVFYKVISDSEGIAKLAINLLPGDYVITVYNPLNGEYESNNIKVLPILEAKDLTKKVSEKASWNITAYNDLGEVAAGVNVTININGVFYNKITDSNGVAHLNINLNPGEYIATAYYNNFAISNKITVLE